MGKDGSKGRKKESKTETKILRKEETKNSKKPQIPIKLEGAKMQKAAR